MVKASDLIAEHLVAYGVDRVFEMTGGMITHLLDSMHLNGGIEITSMHHEQAAAFAAESWARMTGIPGVALGTSGPGAINLLNGIASCYFDSVPGVFITGQVNRDELCTGRPVRQIGFQETDIVSMAKPITKAAWLLDDPEQVADRLAAAFELALAGRPGPVLLDIPMDVSRADIASTPPRTLVVERMDASAADLDRTLEVLDRSERPLILAGGGVRAAAGAHELRGFAAATGIPVITSLLGIDAIAYRDPLRVGLIGSYGNRWANLALGRADTLLVVGSRLDIRQTSACVDEFGAGKTIIQVDVDAGEFGQRIRGVQAIQADAGRFLRQALQAWDGRPALDLAEWRGEIAVERDRWPDSAELASMPGIHPSDVMHALSRHTPWAAAYVSDVGQNQMWAAQSLEVGEDQRFLTSGGLGSMGYALPAAIGVSLARGSAPVVCVTGDGGLQVNEQELESVVRLGLPVKIVVMNNGCLGMVRQFQDDYLESRRQSTEWGYGAPDFVALGEAFGIPSERVGPPELLDAALGRLAADPTTAGLLDVTICGDSSVSPKVMFGRAVFDMEEPG
jgi:acetolactate synthase-1/2/3 large subunit